MAYQDMGNGAVGNGPFGPTGGAVPGGGPQNEVSQLLELRSQIDMRLMELGVPPEAMATPEIAPPIAPPMDPSMAMAGGGLPMPPGGPMGNPMASQLPPGLLG